MIVKKRSFFILMAILLFNIYSVMNISTHDYLQNSIYENMPLSLKTSSNSDFEKLLNDDLQINNYSNNAQDHPSICALSNDTFVVVWQSNGQDLENYGIYATVFNASSGMNITSEFRVNNYTENSQNDPSICALSNDAFVVVWESNQQDGGLTGVYATVFNASTGKNITSEFRVNSFTSGMQWQPSVCALSNETFVVAWTSDGQDLNGSGVYAKLFNASTGKNITSEFRVNNYTDYDQHSPSICALSNETFAVAWTSDEQDLSGYGVYAIVFNASTIMNITSEFRVNSYTDDDQHSPSICSLSSDIFVVAWTSDGQDLSDDGVYAKVFNATTGTSINSEFRVNQQTYGMQQYPSICALLNSTFVVVWASNDLGPSASEVYAKVFNATTGMNITSEFQVNYYTDNHQTYPSICSLSGESFTVVWQSDGQDLNGFGIYAMVFGLKSGDDPDGGDNEPNDFWFLALIIIISLVFLAIISTGVFYSIKKKKTVKMNIPSKILGDTKTPKSIESNLRGEITKSGQIKKKAFSLVSIRELSEEEKEQLKKIESEVAVEKSEYFCVVHKGQIEGDIYLCPKCNTFYCKRCVKSLREKGDKCWVCNSDFKKSGEI